MWSCGNTTTTQMAATQRFGLESSGMKSGTNVHLACVLGHSVYPIGKCGTKMTVDVHLTRCEKLTLKSKGLDPVSKNLLVFGEMPIILLHIFSLHLCHTKKKNTHRGGIKEITNRNKNRYIKKRKTELRG